MNPDRRVMLGMLSAGGFGACTGTALAASDGPDLAQASRDLLFTDVPTARAALKTIVASGRQDMLAVIILARRYVGRGPGLRDDLIRAYRTLSGDDATSWFDMMLWQEKHPGIVPHPSFRQIKLDALARIDPAFLRFLEGERSDPARMRIRLEEIAWGGVRVDGIPSLDDPLLIPAEAADYLLETDLVFGVEINGDARAYPLRIMGWHEMFNDVIGGVPVALAYCTLCGAGILYETALPGFDTPLRFGSSGFLYRSNKLMFDRQTDSLWNQFTGEPVVGPLVGRGLKLRERPVTVTDWRTWRQAHPGGRVLSLQTGHARDYGSGVVYRDYFASEALMFPSAGGGGGLEQKDRIFGLRLPGGAKAYPLHAFRGGRVLNDSVGFADVVLIGDEATRTVRAYESGGRVFSTPDGETVTGPGGMWRIGEEFLTGPDGTRLPRLPGHIAYWFGWQSFLGGNSAFWEG